MKAWLVVTAASPSHSAASCVTGDRLNGTELLPQARHKTNTRPLGVSAGRVSWVMTRVWGVFVTGG